MVILKRDLNQNLLAYSLNSGPSPKPVMHCNSSLYEVVEVKSGFLAVKVFKKEKPRKQPHLHQYSGASLQFCLFFFNSYHARRERLRLEFSLFSFYLLTLQDSHDRGFSNKQPICLLSVFITLMVKRIFKEAYVATGLDVKTQKKCRALKAEFDSKVWTTLSSMEKKIVILGSIQYKRLILSKIKIFKALIPASLIFSKTKQIQQSIKMDLKRSHLTTTSNPPVSVSKVFGESSGWREQKEREGRGREGGRQGERKRGKGLQGWGRERELTLSIKERWA